MYLVHRYSRIPVVNVNLNGLWSMEYGERSTRTCAGTWHVGVARGYELQATRLATSSQTTASTYESLISPTKSQSHPTPIFGERVNTVVYRFTGVNSGSYRLVRAAVHEYSNAAVHIVLIVAVRSASTSPGCCCCCSCCTVRIRGRYSAL